MNRWTITAFATSSLPATALCSTSATVTPERKGWTTLATNAAVSSAIRASVGVEAMPFAARYARTGGAAPAVVRRFSNVSIAAATVGMTAPPAPAMGVGRG